MCLREAFCRLSILFLPGFPNPPRLSFSLKPFSVICKLTKNFCTFLHWSACL